MDNDEDLITLIKTEHDPFNIDCYPESSNHDSEDIKPLRTDVSVEIVSVEPRCLNCGCDIAQKRRHTVARANAEVIMVIRQWIAPQMIKEDDQICHSCFIISLRERSVVVSQPRQLCTTCLSSILRKRFHTLNTFNKDEITNYVIKDIAPKELKGSYQLCHSCWSKYNRISKGISKPPLEPKDLPAVIHLPNIIRPPSDQRQCFYPNCRSKKRKIVPRWLRVKLFTDHKFYIPPKCRICPNHINNYNWDILKSYPNPIHTFTSDHVEDFAAFVNERHSIIDFNNIDEMKDGTVKYWTGLTKEQFKNVYASMPQLQNNKNGQVGLAAYLMKLKTGDALIKIAKLLNIPPSTLLRMMNLARNVLKNLPDDIVPQEIENDVNNDDADSITDIDES